MLEVVSPGVFYGFAIAFGLVVGSFLNVVIYRLPRGESIVHPGSHCPSCDAPVKPWDNLPVVSYLLLRGRCRACGQRIALRYPAVELGNGLLFGALAWQFGPSWMALLFMGLVAALWVAALVDLDHQIIPDSISLGGAVVGLVFMPLVGAHSGTPYGESLLTSFLGAVVGGGTLWSIAFLHARLSVALGRQFPHWPGEGESPPGPRDADYWLWFPGLGLGDVKLLAMVGTFLGPLGVLDTIVAASVLGLVLGLAWAALRRDWSSPFGFGPAIAAGALCSIFFPLHLLILNGARASLA